MRRGFVFCVGLDKSKSTFQMDKKCFVIMPISDSDGYPQGHFNRVYQHLIKPACERAGFVPIRADEVSTTNYIALDIIKQIINSDMALCDLSDRNPNVLYELGIRQAFNLPVTLIKDNRTDRVFDIQGFRDVEYDESLRIDNVEQKIDEIAEVLLNTHSNTNEINSLVGLLGIEPAKLSERTTISGETELILNSIGGLEKRVYEMEQQIKSGAINDFHVLANARIEERRVGDELTLEEIGALRVHDEIFHNKYGYGRIIRLSRSINDPSDTRVKIVFEIGHSADFYLRHAKLKKVLK